MNIKPGLWTPWAKVVCYECHGPTFKNSGYDHSTGKFCDETLSEEEWNKVTTEVEVKKGNGITFCDDCQKEIQVDDSVAAEHNLMRRIREAGIDASMAQTGGMNSACEISAKDEGWYLATYNWDGDKNWIVCRYDKEGEPLNLDGFIGKTDDEVFTYITNQNNVNRL